MSKHDEIAAIVEKYCGELAEYDLTYNNKRYWVFYSYKTFPANKKSNLLKFDKNLFEADMAAMYSIDSGVINPDAEKCKDGILFMLSGFYIRTSGQLKGYTFIKYSAIKSIEVKGKKDLHLSLNVNTNDFWKQDWLNISVDYYAEPLKNILEEIIKIDREADTSYTTESKTGIVKGINQKANREAYFKGQISGYKRASREYQIKLQKQADAFLANCNLWRKKQSEYEALLDEYEQTIIELQSCMEQSSSPEYQEMMDSAQDYKERLEKMAC